jgi:hypothetical protein
VISQGTKRGLTFCPEGPSPARFQARRALVCALPVVAAGNIGAVGTVAVGNFVELSASRNPAADPESGKVAGAEERNVSRTAFPQFWSR